MPPSLKSDLELGNQLPGAPVSPGSGERDGTRVTHSPGPRHTVRRPRAAAPQANRLDAQGRNPQRPGQCPLRRQVAPRPDTALGGGERRAGAAEPARVCPRRARHAPLPAAASSDGQQSRGPRPPAQTPHPEAQARGPTYHAGRGRAAQVSWLSSCGHVPRAQVRSWSPQAREVPRPGPDNRRPTRAPRGPSKASAAPRPASSGTP